MIHSRLVFSLLLICLCDLVYSQTINIIPMPKKVEMKLGFFTINDKTAIFYNDPQLEFLAGYTSTTIKSLNKLQLAVKQGNGIQRNAQGINLIIDGKAVTAKEGYLLSVNSSEITIRAATSQGLFYGVQSLLQLIPINEDRKIQALEIADEPRFSWRG